MNFEYGCQITNRYNLFIDREDDGNELLAGLNTEKSSKPSKETPKSQSKTTNKNTATKSKDKDTKSKAPLQQADNSVKSKLDERKTSAKQQTQQPKEGRQNQNRTQTPREDKENNDNKQRQQNQGNREFAVRRPRNDAGLNNDGQREKRENNDGTKPPRPRNQNRPARIRSDFNDNNNQEPIGDHQQSNPNNNETGQNSGGYVNRRGGASGSGRGLSGRGNGGRGGFGRRRPQAEREFDRHSGSDKTGVKAVDKKEGAGKSNWGTISDELAVDEQTEEKQAEVAEEKKNWADRVDESEQKETEETEENKEVAKLMTLDEYKALKNEINKKNQTSFNIRQPGEGEAPNKWNNLTVLKKKVEEDDDENIEDEDEEEDYEETEQDEDEKKKLVNQIKIQFYEPTNKFSRGGGSNNRGGQRDRRTPRTNKGQKLSNQEKKVPSIQNESDFPSLSKN